MSVYTANVEQDGRFWLIRVEEIDRVTQARNLREVEEMARDLIAVMEEVESDSFALTINLSLPANAQHHIDEALRLREEAAEANRRAAEESRAAAKELAASGLPLRDVGKVLGVSHQRAQQLVNA